MADTTLDLMAGGQIPQSRDGMDELSRRAVRAFREMLPAMNAYAKALTGNNKIVVEMHARENGATDGKKIFIRPPMFLAFSYPHERMHCGDRDPETLEQICKECARREQILIILYHEIAHIAYGSFMKVTDYQRKKFLDNVAATHPSKYAERIKKVLEDTRYSPATASWQGLSNLLGPHFGFLVNAIEDCRVNIEMFKARPGTHAMMSSKCVQIFKNGVEQTDPLTGEVKVILWKDYPLDAQMAISIFAKVMRIEGAFFDQKVLDALEDKKLALLMGDIAGLRSAEGVVKLAFKILMRLRELGFMLLPEEREEEENNESQEDSDPDQGDESDESVPGEGEDADQSEGSGQDGSDAPDPDQHGSESSSDAGDSGGLPDRDASEGGDPDGEPEEGSGVPEDNEGGTESESDAAGGDSSDSEDGAGDPGMGSEPGGDPGDADSGAGEPGSGDGDGTSSDLAEAGDEDGDADDGDAGDGRSPGAGHAGTGDLDGDQDSDDAGEPDLSSSGDSGSAGQDSLPGGTVGSASDEGDLSDEATEGDDRGDSTDGGVESSDSDNESSGPADAGGGDPATGASPDEPGAESPEGDDGPGGQADGKGDSAADPSPGENAPLETGSHQGGGIEIIEVDGGDDAEDPEEEASVPDHGTPEDIEVALAKFGDHEHKPETLVMKRDKERYQDALKVAIIQDTFFESPSKNVNGVWFGKFNEERNSWTDKNGYVLPSFGNNEKAAGVDGDFDPEERILGPALLEMRRTFSDNRAAGWQGNQKSGRVNVRSLGRRAWQGDDDRLFRRKLELKAKEYFVCIGLDVSGSTLGENIVLIKRAAMAQAELCHRLGIPFVVYAHTGDGFYDDAADVALFEVKTEDQPWDDKARQRLRRLRPYMANLDGHTLEQYRKICDRQARKRQSVILYYTDGAMPAENHDEELEILIREIQYCKQRRYVLLGVGIKTESPKAHGLETVRVDDDSDVIKVVQFLKNKILSI